MIPIGKFTTFALNASKPKGILPMKNLKRIQKDLDKLEFPKNKRLFINELAEAVEEMMQIKEGKIKARDADDFLNEI